MSKKRLPDLRAHYDDFTIEHAHHLLVKLAEVLDNAGQPGHKHLVNLIDPENVQLDILSKMKGYQVGKLYDTEFGQGLLVGLFYSTFAYVLDEIEPPDSY